MKNDARVKYTKNTLKLSFLQLLETKPIKSITVKELCENAGINRATFYAHYKDCFDLLEQIEDELVQDVMSSLSYLSSSDVTAMLNGIFNLLEQPQNAKLCKILFSGNGARSFINKFVDSAHDSVISYWSRLFKNTSREKLEMSYIYITNGALSVIENYVKDKTSINKEDVISFLKQSVYGGLSIYS